MGVSSLPKTVTRQRRGCDLNPSPSAPESSTLTTRLPSHPGEGGGKCPAVTLGSAAPRRRLLRASAAPAEYQMDVVVVAAAAADAGGADAAFAGAG